MSSVHYSSSRLRSASTNADTIAAAISSHPVHHINGSELGHPGVVSALRAFGVVWARDFHNHHATASGASQLLGGAAADADRLDALLAQAADAFQGIT